LSDDILIVGGGLAGLSTADVLNRRGHDVTLLEKRDRLGGRASSYELDSFPLEVDNCQHVLVGSCHACLSLIERTAGKDVLEKRSSVPVLSGENGSGPGELTEWPITDHPAPFHLMSLLNRASGGLFPALRNGLRLLSLSLEDGPSDRTAADWLRRHQPSELVESLWRPLTTSALNETLERVGLDEFKKWVFTGMVNNRSAPVLYIPADSLKSLYGERVGQALVSEGVTIRRGTRVRELDPQAPSVTLDDGTELEADSVVSALTDRVLWARLPGRVRDSDPFNRIPDWEHAPIISVHLLFEGEFDLPDYALLSHSPFEWLFALRQPAEPVTYAQCVKSAAWDAVDWSKERLVEEATEAIDALGPDADARIESRVIKEKNATLSMTPETARERFGPDTPFESFYVAGDWIDQEWPPTMEAAVRSGQLVASRIDPAIEPPAPAPASDFMRLFPTD
jgi:squalene-associated FAD-dependent desaturase